MLRSVQEEERNGDFHSLSRIASSANNDTPSWLLVNALGLKVVGQTQQMDESSLLLFHWGEVVELLLGITKEVPEGFFDLQGECWGILVAKFKEQAVVFRAGRGFFGEVNVEGLGELPVPLLQDANVITGEGTLLRSKWLAVFNLSADDLLNLASALAHDGDLQEREKLEEGRYKGSGGGTNLLGAGNRWARRLAMARFQATVAAFPPLSTGLFTLSVLTVAFVANPQAMMAARQGLFARAATVTEGLSTSSLDLNLSPASARFLHQHRARRAAFLIVATV